MQHQEAAEKVCHRLFEALKAAPPSAYVLAKRSKIVAQKAEEIRQAEARQQASQPRAPKAGQSGADLDSLFGVTDPLESAPAPVTPAKADAGAASSSPVVAQPVADEKMVPVQVTIPPPRMRKPDQEA